MTVGLENCGKSAVKHFLEKPILFNFFNLFTMFCTGLRPEVLQRLSLLVSFHYSREGICLNDGSFHRGSSINYVLINHLLKVSLNYQNLFRMNIVTFITFITFITLKTKFCRWNLILSKHFLNSDSHKSSCF